MADVALLYTMLLTTRVVGMHSLDRALDNSPSSSVSSTAWPARNRKFLHSCRLVPVHCEQLNHDGLFFLIPIVVRM